VTAGIPAPPPWTPPARVRPKVACVLRRGDAVLVFEDRDHTAGTTFHCLPGGGIEFRESSAEAAVREMREEIGIAVEPVRLLGVVESLFRRENEPGHEIVFAWEVRPADPGALAILPAVLTEDDGAVYRLLWRPLADPMPLHPAELAGLLGAMA